MYQRKKIKKERKKRQKAKFKCIIKSKEGRWKKRNTVRENEMYQRWKRREVEEEKDRD